MKRTRTTRFVLAGSAAALALGVAACEVENGTDPALDDPVMEDDGLGDDM